MDANLLELLSQIPLAGLVIVVVVIFLKHEKEHMDAESIEREKSQEAFLNELKNIRMTNQTTLDAITNKLSELTLGIKEISNRIDRMENRISKQ